MGGSEVSKTWLLNTNPTILNSFPKLSQEIINDYASYGINVEFGFEVDYISNNTSYHLFGSTTGSLIYILLTPKMEQTRHIAQLKKFGLMKLIVLLHLMNFQPEICLFGFNLTQLHNNSFCALV